MKAKKASKTDSKADNSGALKKLIEEAGITQKEAAERLKLACGEPVAERTIRAWVNKRGSQSARRCPAWAVTLLRQSLVSH